MSEEKSNIPNENKSSGVKSRWDNLSTANKRLAMIGTFLGTIIAILLAIPTLVSAFKGVFPNCCGQLGLTSTSTVTFTPTMTATATPTGTPTPTNTPSPKEEIENVILAYYNNVQNDRIPDEDIDLDIAWSALHEKLQDIFGPRDEWGRFILESRHNIKLDFLQTIVIDNNVAKADIDLTYIPDLGERAEKTITICLLREGGTWLINHINTGVIPLEECKD